MKIITLLLLTLVNVSHGEPLWKRVHLPGRVIDIPVLSDGSLDNSRLQRRADRRGPQAALTPNTNPLWAATRVWDKSAEQEYQDWISNNLTEEFFKGGGVVVDCADAAIALRWIFARQNGLPAGQTLAGSGRLLGSWSSTNEWDTLPGATDWKKDERFKAALRYLLDHIYTHSILGDLYPVEITPEYVVPGTVYLTLFGSSGHTRTLMKVNPPMLDFIFGNEPADEQIYFAVEYPYWVDERSGGLMHFRWPEETSGVWALRAADQMPGFSREQYVWGEYDYSTKFSERMFLWDTLHAQITAAAKQLSENILSRSQVVMRGFYLCSVVPCTPGSVEDHKYSTPQRDHRLGEQANTVDHMIQRLDPTDWLHKDLTNKYGHPVIWGMPINHIDLFSRAAVRKLASDPTLSLFARWGLPDMTDAAGFRMRAYAFIKNYHWRHELVQQGIDLCYPGGALSPQCDPASKEVAALNTSRLDQAFRVEKAALNIWLNRFSAQEAMQLNFELQMFGTGLMSCNGQCNAKQLLDGTFIDKMTSSPLDPIAQRNGTY